MWLRRAGYRTAFVGKYLNGYGEGDRELIPPGWEDWQAAVSATRYLKTPYNRNGEVDKLEPGLYRTDADARMTRDVIRRWARSPRPFFIWVGFQAPHVGGPDDPDDPPDLETPSPAPRYRDRFRRLPLPTPPGFNEPDAVSYTHLTLPTTPYV